MKYAAIADWADAGEYTVSFMCRFLGVSRSGYYEWRQPAVSARARVDAELSAVIAHLHAAEDGNPGVRRVHAALAAGGWRVGQKRVWRLMHAAGLRGRRPGGSVLTTVPGQASGPVPDLVNRDFTAGRPNEKWCGDITYVKTWDGWAYLATVIDLYSRKVIGWAVAEHMRTSLAVEALEMALTHRQPQTGVIFHSDRGSQYTASEFAAYCAENGIRRSVGRTGICFDNAVAEAFFATYKTELVHHRPWPTLNLLKQATFAWIETCYNTRRRHSTLGYLTPNEYELGYRHIHQLAA